VATTVLGNLGFEDKLYDFGSAPAEPLSDMNVAGGLAAGAWWFRLYWAAFAVALLCLAHLLWRRGTDARLGRMLRRLPSRLRSPAGGVLLAGDAAGMALPVLLARGVAAQDSGHALPWAADAAAVAALRLAGTLPPLAALPLYVEPPAVRPPAAP